jgi:hypothetical protein
MVQIRSGVAVIWAVTSYDFMLIAASTGGYDYAQAHNGRGVQARQQV